MASRTVTEQPGRARIRAPHLRRDAWWLPPLVTVVVLAGFVVYGTWVAFVNRDYWADPYLSPFYSPCLAKACAEPTWAIVGSWWPLSPALLVLPFPLGFRLTCYYYRKAYYRSFWRSRCGRSASPTASASGWARWCCWSTPRSCGCTRSPATPAGTCAAGT
jgi:hypothetical protein